MGASRAPPEKKKGGLFGSLKPSETVLDEKVSEKVNEELEKQYQFGLQFKGKRSGLGFSE